VGELKRRTDHRVALLLAPVLVPLTMTATFAGLGRLLGPRRGYNAGFLVYWVGWCGIFPLWVAGPRRIVRSLTTGARPSPFDAALLALPMIGAATTELLPNRRGIDKEVAAVMVGSAAINAVGEEVLWRGLYLDAFPDDLWNGAVWPTVGFVLWHLAPQVILPSRRGRAPFLAGAAAVGAAASRTAWHGRGLRWTLVPHIATDACGVTAARFRLGR